MLKQLIIASTIWAYYSESARTNINLRPWKVLFFSQDRAM